MTKRILGDLRIFQAVANDLGFKHVFHEGKYTYDGIDPYVLEDDAFPTVVADIEKYAEKKALEAQIAILEELDVDNGSFKFLEIRRRLRELYEKLKGNSL